ncbi:hypothetical protein AAZX31_04G142700 [Glycine max]|uniref:TRF2/HOY1 PH-like domain-containing protein n=4 Tax=Glycine subgen. Soja TaxID=1462606 RepID=I1JWD7_SOYBN|nr:uncharacterized protein LOC100807349 [Glycine max]XP_028228945.1 uncharacterized protein LOC114409627 [Glycine soja]KAG5066586.1 hypothetical protein JHK86_010317 [Glycine max]KAH1111527.1 hypothetical protein GYH30_010071 [Glycine max]KAH1254055.1 hypothetical protein GmHk_04G010578 [Glycine max]KRH63129.1 hypothetical protein GLYMA_04G156300v4 [Glycine max]RZC16717.1 hypothetical protein D0Y65_009849 [Glycine soja]|eukprot:XP_003522941.1 uncharacterized protein LOC100807349 [Glycine max]
MVQLMKNSRKPETASSVKLEIVEDSLEEEHAPLNKRCKPSASPLPQPQQWNASDDGSVSSPSHLNILDEPSPLGLRLRKSPSLLDLIQMKLSQGSAQQKEDLSSEAKRESRCASAAAASSGAGAADKLKASNFPASLLRIGSWEYKSRYEGDLVAKCYFAKHKLVWEVLEGGLKSKIEIQWSDIMALKAHCPDNGPSTLTVVLARQPLYFRETNPQPRKHTLWQATADFTDGQSSKHRLHFLQCPQGLLAKHFEKLIQCDMRLNFLSQQPEIILDSPHFDTQPSAFEDPDNPKDHDLLQVSGKGSSTSCYQDSGSPQASLSSSFKIEHNDPPGMMLDSLPRDAPSPSSVMECTSIEGSTSSETDSKGPRNGDQIKLPGLRPSMSVSDFIGQIELCLSEQITSGNPPFSDGGSEYKEILEDIAQHLLNDNQVAATSDEKSLMSRVNSLCCLLQKDPVTVQNSHFTEDNTVEGPDDGKDVKPAVEESKDASGGKQALGMSRKDSFSDLLLHLPRIASLPKFLFNISEEDGNSHAR